jgi:citrate lyase subunit beta/citryl-CoA lyase
MSMTKSAEPLLARSYLYVPGHRPDLASRAASSGADAVIVDLEDALPTGARSEAVATLHDFAVAVRSQPDVVLLGVRIGDLGPLGRVEVENAVEEGVDFIRIPKVSRPDEVRKVADWVRAAERAAATQSLIRMQLLLESSPAILDARSLAVDDHVERFALGASDLAADLHLVPGADEALDVARGLLVLSSAAAGLMPPVESVYVDYRDTAGLRASTERAREHGFFGRSAIHPSQIETINNTFLPHSTQVEWAEGVCAASDSAEGGATQFEGRLVDAAVVRRARWVLVLRDRFGSRDGAVPSVD